MQRVAVAGQSCDARFSLISVQNFTHLSRMEARRQGFQQMYNSRNQNETWVPFWSAVPTVARRPTLYIGSQTVTATGFW